MTGRVLLAAQLIPALCADQTHCVSAPHIFEHHQLIGEKSDSDILLDFLFQSCVLPKFGIEREVRVCDSCFDQYGPKEEEGGSPVHEKVSSGQVKTALD